MELDRRSLIIGASGVAAAAAGGSAAEAAAANASPIVTSTGASPAMRIRWAFSVSIFFKERIRITSNSRRVFVPAMGGDVWGPRLNGKVVPYGGADYAGGQGLDAHYALQADNGQMIYINNRGFMTPQRAPGALPPPPPAPPPPRKPGEPINQSFEAPADSQVPLKMRLTPFFDAPNGPHAWMSRTLFVGHGQRFQGPDHTIFTYYEVL